MKWCATGSTMVIFVMPPLSVVGCWLLSWHNLAKQHSTNMSCSQSISFPLFSFNNFSLSNCTGDEGMTTLFYPNVTYRVYFDFTWISSVGFSTGSTSMSSTVDVDVIGADLKLRSYSAFSNIMRSLYSDLVTISLSKKGKCQIDLILIGLIDWSISRLPVATVAGRRRCATCPRNRCR